MPDENFRPTHGLPPDSRPTNVPPPWWSLLNREDLPTGQADAEYSTANRWSREQGPRGELLGRRRARAPRGWRMLLVNVTVLVSAVLLVVVGVAVTAPRGVAAVLLVTGMLALLAVLGVNIALRISRRW
jgi:hypothetical protein